MAAAGPTECPFEVIQWRHQRAQSAGLELGAISAQHSLCWLVKQTDGKTKAVLDDSGLAREVESRGVREKESF